MQKLVFTFLFILFFTAQTAESAPSCNASDIDLGKYKHTRDESKVNNVETDHFALVFSWSPGFCENKRDRQGNVPAYLKFQCDSGHDFGWVVHGLWGEAKGGVSSGTKGGHPRYCTEKDLPDLPETLIRRYMCMSPGAGLLQGEWEKHGACDFKKAENYFAMTEKLAAALVLPDQGFKENEMKNWMKANNPALKDIKLGWLPKSGELAVCYDTAFNLMDCK